MNQKQTLCELLIPMSHCMREYAVKLWLEDINWHTEAATINQSRPEYIKALEDLDYHLRPADYDAAWVRDQRDNNPIAYRQAQKYLNGEGDRSMYYNGEIITDNDLHEMKLAKRTAWAMSYIWGWGLNTPSWNGQTQGENLVIQLRQCIDNPEATKEDR